jgi:hypothetical protein
MACQLKGLDIPIMKGKQDIKCVQKFMVYCNILFQYTPGKKVHHLLKNVESTAEVM